MAPIWSINKKFQKKKYIRKLVYHNPTGQDVQKQSHKPHIKYDYSQLDLNRVSVMRYQLQPIKELAYVYWINGGYNI